MLLIGSLLLKSGPVRLENLEIFSDVQILTRVHQDREPFDLLVLILLRNGRRLLIFRIGMELLTLNPLQVDKLLIIHSHYKRILLLICS